LHLKDEQSLQYLITACDSFWNLAPRILWAAASLHIIQGLVSKWRIQLPQNAVEALLGPGGRLPDFDFAATGHANSYLTNVSIRTPHDFAFEGSFSYATDLTGEHMRDHVFAPFPNQQPPLLGPLLDDLEQMPANMLDGLGGTSATVGMEWLSEEWLPAAGAWGPMDPNLPQA